ncbi:MAG: hypothetical protein M1820_004087 [Bogoriella megaspora]|nr:MAG: hypothetical protein M1820_004087 [Bogoriella megaspora]
MTLTRKTCPFSLHLAALTCILAFASSTAVRQRLPHVAENIAEPMLKTRQQPSTIPITGASSGNGVQPRLEIRQLQQNADQWNLYMLGLQRMQQANQSDPLSWYQIAGIHGRPYVPWDNVQMVQGGNGGYCTHISTLFLSWHRPYLALFEQVLYSSVTEVANEFPSGAIRQRYTEAAMSFRIPYWDWAVAPPEGNSTMPDSISSPTVTVTAPSNINSSTVSTQIPNPLYSYAFHPLVPSDFYWQDHPQFANWTETLRWPANLDVNAASQDELAVSTIDKNRPNLRDRVYNLMTSATNYTTFSTEMWAANGAISGYDSLESIHDVIHQVTGGNLGHMFWLDYSAFDPIFWLHHANIDRLFAMWQVINPDTYLEPALQVYPTFAYNTSIIQDGNSRLAPFHTNSNGEFWTSYMARSVDAMAYSYPELWNNATNQAASASDIRTSINNLYGNGTYGSQPAKRDANGGSAEPPRQEYMATIRAEKNGLGYPFSVYIFVGHIDEQDPLQWARDPNLVGSQAFFASSDFTVNGVMSSGMVPLTTTLAAKMQNQELEGLEVEQVSEYLEQNLGWRIVKVRARFNF